MSAASVLTGASVVTTGLMAGLFFGWAVSVIPGTKQVDDHTYVETMQSINRAIINPGFVVPFVATPLVLGAAAFAQARVGNIRAAWWLGSATVLYTVGLIGVTGVGNIPLNDALDRFSLDATDRAALAERRRTYESPWNRWHALRTAAAVAALGCASIAALVESD
ncbi:anthrone oxygenase family protein [Ilumatobacter coccineus]|uniref:DUF1772 domain-containing protein n=1 Tax=Ilumatobacter coccineus (strain NBRC 103263 / KCTC 29153 / YM16-304) TaxID=1313172 RepID=A0A6C7EBH4_ILUCY|nr:anthrone oxygenase family protein [Ilumatobacter coccineus]BAN01988.1 hypothetical protein YM304_16740 [Ilumatobacter coccineus YM16-304]